MKSGHALPVLAGHPADELAPPLAGGMPLLGQAWALWRRPIDLLTHAYRQHGELFRFAVGAQQVTVLIGPKQHQAFFAAPAAVLAPPAWSAAAQPLFGAGAPPDSPAPDKAPC